jgi:foldase protein PrsA
MIFNRKHWLVLTVILLMIWAVGCNLVQVDPEKDRQRVVAEVDGEKILKGEVLDLYDQQKIFWGISEEQEKDPEYKDFIKQMKESILDQLVTQEIQNKKAEQAGFVVNDEYLDEARKELDQQIESYAEFLKSQDAAAKAQENDDKEGQKKDYNKQAREALKEQLDEMNITEEEYIQIMAEQIRTERFKEKMLEDVKVTQGDIEKYYNEQLKSQKENPESVHNAPIQLYRPPGSVRVKHILIPLPDDEREEYYELVNEGKDEEAKQYLSEKLKAIKPKAQEALDKAKAGEDFESLIESYSQDDSEVNRDDGYIIFKDSRIFSSEFEETALKLKEGEVSQLVDTPFGYHVIKLYEKLPEEEFSLEDKKEEISDMVMENKRNDRWDELVEEWKSQAKIKKYQKRL